MVLVGAREERLAQNEALFRQVNERVVEVATHFIEVEAKGEAVEFTCECGRRDCTERIAMTVAEYQAIRAESTRFAVLPGHELPEVESVAERHPTYLVVEKRDPDAQEIARETDPRT
jgi:predicted NBD/HSP70 family sugar kinase